jgi:hypothetical protein
MLPAILGGLATGIGGSLAGSLFGGMGGSGPTYEPSPTMEALSEYGLGQIKADKSLKKSLKSQFKRMSEGGNRGGAEAFLEAYRGRFSNPKFIEKTLGRSYSKDIDYNRPTYFDIADQIYNQAGVGFSGDEYSSFVDRAKARGIRSPQAFQDMLRQDLIASGKIMTPQQEQLSYMFGTPSRDQSGRITNLYKAIPKFDPSSMAQMIPRNDNNEYTFNINYKQNA